MMNKIKYIAALLVMAALAACHQEQDELLTEAHILMTAPDSISIEQMQGTLTLKDMNTARSISTADLHDNGFTINILRGAYRVDVEGMVRYHSAAGRTSTCNFRVHSDYTPLIGVPTSTASLPIILLDE